MTTLTASHTCASCGHRAGTHSRYCAAPDLLFDLAPHDSTYPNPNFPEPRVAGPRGGAAYHGFHNHPIWGAYCPCNDCR